MNLKQKLLLSILCFVPLFCLAAPTHVEDTSATLRPIPAHPTSATQTIIASGVIGIADQSSQKYHLHFQRICPSGYFPFPIATVTDKDNTGSATSSSSGMKISMSCKYIPNDIHPTEIDCDITPKNFIGGVEKSMQIEYIILCQ